jgi:histidine triad (HIT) family protein
MKGGCEMDGCLFCRIIKKEINAKIIYEDEQVLAFEDINPQAPVHFLVVPKKHIASVNEIQSADAELTGRMFIAAKNIASEKGVAGSGYRAVFNTGSDAGQAVAHLHLHITGGRKHSWPAG